MANQNKDEKGKNKVGKIPIMWWFPILFFSLVISVFTIFLAVIEIQKAQEEFQLSQIKIFSRQALRLINSKIELFNSDLSNLTTNVELISSLPKTKTPQKVYQPNLAMDSLNKHIKVYWIPKGHIEAIADTILSYAVLDMVSKLEQGHTIHPEAHGINNQHFLRIAKPVYELTQSEDATEPASSEKKSFLGSLLLSVDLNYLFREIPPIIQTNHRVEIYQAIGENDPYIIYEAGTAGPNTQQTSFKSSIPNWHIAFYLPQYDIIKNNLLDKNIQKLILKSFTIPLMLTLGLLIYICLHFWLINYRIKQDLLLLNEHFRCLSHGEKVPDKPFKLFQTKTAKEIFENNLDLLVARQINR